MPEAIEIQLKKGVLELCVLALLSQHDSYAYEIADRPFVSDADFDYRAQQIRPRMATGHPLLDEFFLAEFSPMTGMWIHHHPELAKIRDIYDHYVRVVDPPVWRNRFAHI